MEWCSGKAAVVGIFTVFPVAQEWKSVMSHLDPDLMVAPGIQMDLDYRIRGAGIRIRIKGAVMKACRFRSRRVRLADPGSVGAPVFDQMIFQVRFGRDRDPPDCGKVIFPKTGACQLTRKFPGGSRGLGKDEKSFYRLVQTMDHGKVRLFWLPAFDVFVFGR